MVSCAQMGKYKSSYYKYSTQILDKFWLQHSHSKNSDASCLTCFQKCICFMNASALKVTSLPAILVLLPEHWGKLYSKKRKTNVSIDDDRTVVGQTFKLILTLYVAGFGIFFSNIWVHCIVWGQLWAKQKKKIDLLSSLQIVTLRIRLIRASHCIIQQPSRSKVN